MDYSNIHIFVHKSLFEEVFLRIQLILVVCAFAYPWFYFSIMRSIDILYAATIEAGTQARWVKRCFTDSPHHLVFGGYKLRPFMVNHSENPPEFDTFPVLRDSHVF